jgi:hypothetical protein
MKDLMALATVELCRPHYSDSYRSIAMRHNVGGAMVAAYAGKFCIELAQ